MAMVLLYVWHSFLCQTKCSHNFRYEYTNMCIRRGSRRDFCGHTLPAENSEREVGDAGLGVSETRFVGKENNLQSE